MVCFFPIIEPYLTIKLNIFNFFILKKYSRVKIVCPHKAQSDHKSSSNLTYSWPYENPNECVLGPRGAKDNSLVNILG